MYGQVTPSYFSLVKRPVVLSFELGCGSFVVHAAETQPGLIGCPPRQLEGGDLNQLQVPRLRIQQGTSMHCRNLDK